MERRLIDANELMGGFNVRKVAEYDESGCGMEYEAVPVEVIEKATTIDAEPVRHGRYDEGGDCTVCGYPMPTDDRCDAIFPQEIKYCYNCGAKMDLEVQE